MIMVVQHFDPIHIQREADQHKVLQLKKRTEKYKSGNYGKGKTNKFKTSSNCYKSVMVISGRKMQ